MNEIPDGGKIPTQKAVDILPFDTPETQQESWKKLVDLQATEMFAERDRGNNMQAKDLNNSRK